MQRCFPFAVLALTWASVASAETPMEAARRHFDRGVQLAESNSLELAVEEFRRAYEESPHFSVLYNLGQAYVGLERPVEAADALAKYLADGGDKIPGDRRSEVDLELEQQRAHIATVLLTADPGATLFVDGQPVGTSPMPSGVRLAEGAHAFSARLPGTIPDQRTEDAPGGRSTVVALHLTPLPLPAPRVAFTPPASAYADTPSESRGVQRPIGYVVGAAGIVGIGIGIGFGLSARSSAHSRDDVADACGRRCGDGDIARATRFHEDATRAATVANVAYVAGALVAAGGIALVLTAPSARPRPTALAHPFIAPHTLGLAARGTF